MLFETNGPDLAVDRANRKRDDRPSQTKTSETLSQDAIALDFQPVVEMRSGVLRGFEAVARLPPDGTGAETSRLLALACVEVRYWPGCRIAMNIPARGFASGAFLEQVDTALTISGLAPWLLKIELSESSRLPSLAVLRGLRARGVGIVLDDFGASDDSLKLLHRMPWTAVRLDRRLVHELPTDAEALCTVRALLDAAHARGLRTIAGGLETLAQRHLLIRLGCEAAQGPLYSRPMAPDRLAALLDYGVDTCSEPRSGSETRDDRAVPH